ncbi:MAG: tRNA (adenosine(37)-N6)-threonylcarbamoyltransferase complex transferase subunit TsaD, partial [Eubacteriales bacterium]
PFLCLCVSGGTTALVDVQDYTTMTLIGSTRDDAVGECFDKVARVLGIGYPGGKPLDDLSQTGDPTTYPLPRSKVDGSPYDMSFSGLKTASLNLIHNLAQKEEALHLPNFAASFSSAITDTLVPRTLSAAKEYGHTKIAVAGGVAANSQLRTHLQAQCKQHNLNLYLPQLSLCGDNAAMIGAQGYYEYLNGTRATLDLNAYATRPLSTL